MDSMVEEIIDDIVTERLSNVHQTLGPSASEYRHGTASPLKEYGAAGSRPTGVVKLGEGKERALYDEEE